LNDRKHVMADTLEGCDWCCGWGDEELEEINARIEKIDAVFASLQ
jgi:hypothetical protein